MDLLPASVAEGVTDSQDRPARRSSVRGKGVTGRASKCVWTLLHPDMEVVKAQKSAVIRIEVPPCTFSSTFNDCAGTVEAALNAAGRLAAIRLASSDERV